MSYLTYTIFEVVSSEHVIIFTFLELSRTLYLGSKVSTPFFLGGPFSFPTVSMGRETSLLVRSSVLENYGFTHGKTDVTGQTMLNFYTSISFSDLIMWGWETRPVERLRIGNRGLLYGGCHLRDLRALTPLHTHGRIFTLRQTRCLSS